MTTHKPTFRAVSMPRAPQAATKMQLSAFIHARPRPILGLALPGLLLILALVVVGCVPLPGQPGLPAPVVTATPLPSPELPTPTPWPPAARARAALAAQLGIPPSGVTLISSEPADWPDGCLGVSQPGVMCTQAIVPGYRIILEADGQQYEVRTDRSGAAVVVVPAGQAGPADPPAVLAARTAIATQLGLELTLVRALAVEPMTWPDACLGVPQPGEMCAEVLTPGYRIIVEADGVRYVFHTDEPGGQVRAAPVLAEEPAVATILRDLLASQLGIGAEAVQIVSFEAVEWPDACLGIQMPDLGCAQVVTPGFRIVLEAEGRRFTYHTDATGDSIMLAGEAATGQTPAAAITWQGEGMAGCVEARITDEAITYGACGAAALTAPLLTEFDRPAELAALVADYTSFSANTPAGKVVFTGAGATQATPAEQRMIAAWAAGVVEEAQLGRGAGRMGQVVRWTRQGGIAGFCDELTIFRTGLAYAADCQGKALGDGKAQRLTAAELATLYDWLDTLAPFEFEQQDPATADALKITLAFTGAGVRAPNEADKQVIAAFCSQIMARWAE